MGQPPNEFAELLISVQDLTTSRYLTMAAYCLLYYDLLLRFSTEVSLIWTAPWNVGKVLYFLNRYPIFFEVGVWAAYYFDFAAHDSFCDGIARSWTWVYIMLTIPPQLIVMLRTIAIWNNNKVVRASVILSFIVYLIAGLLSNGMVMRSDTFTTIPLVKPIIGCTSEVQTQSPKLTIFAWGFELFYDGLVFFLILYRSEGGELGRSRLMQIIFRDGCLYYLAMLASNVVNVAFFAALPTSRAGLLTAAPSVQIICMSLMANRIMLNMRCVASGKRKHEISTAGRDEPEMQFAKVTAGQSVVTDATASTVSQVQINSSSKDPQSDLV